MHKIFIWTGILLLTGNACSFSQTFDSIILQYYSPPDRIPEEYFVNANLDYANLIAHPRPEIKLSDYKRFAEAIAYQKKHLFLSGDVYFDWPEMEDYISDVLSKISEGNNIEDEKIQVLIVNHPLPNAYALYDGTLFVTLGLLADVRDEAALAMILGHEISHYLNNDLEDIFVNLILRSNEKGKKKTDTERYEISLDYSHESQKAELLADSLGFVLAGNAGYNLESGYSNFFFFKQLKEYLEEESLIVSSGRIVNVTEDGQSTISKESLHSHPEFEQRIGLLNRIRNKQLYEGTDFLVSKKDFLKVQLMARTELLNTLIRSNEPRLALVKAFTYHLFEQDNKVYTYYILESIRRLFFHYPKLMEEGFLTERTEKFQAGKGILNDLSYLIKDSLLLHSIPPTLISSLQPELETYGSAFEYFSKLASTENIAEAYLTRALASTTSAEEKTVLLEKYISSGVGRHQRFAEELLGKEQVALTKFSKEVILLNNVLRVEETKNGLFINYIQGDTEDPIYIEGIQSMLSKKFPSRELITFDYGQNNLRKYQDLQLVLNASKFLMEKGYQEEKREASESFYFNDAPEEEENASLVQELDIPRLLLYAPEFYKVIERYNIKSVSQLDILCYDNKTLIYEYLNPFILFNVRGNILGRILYGSLRYFYMVNLYTYHSNSNETASNYTSEVNYKMRLPYVLNTIYYLLKDN